MSQLYYGPIKLSVVKTHQYVRQPVYNGRDYLYTRHLLSVRAVFNPFTTPYLMPGNPVSNPPVVQNNPAPNQFNAFIPQVVPPQTLNNPNPLNAAVIDQSIRYLLMRPRQQLDYQVGGVHVLFSPTPGYSADCNYGPIPREVNVVTWLGPKTCMIDFTVETWTNENILFPGGKDRSPLVSLQWETEENIDQDYYSVRTTRGRAVFRSDLLLPFAGAISPQGVQSPDFLRNKLFLPIPTNFKREKVYVRLRDDNVTLDFVVVDRQSALNWSRQNVTRVEAVQTAGLIRAGEEEAISNMIRGLIGSPLRHDESGPGSIWETAGWPILGFFPAALDSLPVLSHEWNITVYGNRQAFRSDLQQFAVDIWNARVALIQANFGATKFLLTHDLAGTMVNLKAQMTTGPIMTMVAGNTSSTTFANKVFPTQNDDTGNLLVASSQQQIPPPPHDQGSRGTYLEVLAVQALSDPFNAVTRPAGFSPAPN